MTTAVAPAPTCFRPTTFPRRYRQAAKVLSTYLKMGLAR